MKKLVVTLLFGVVSILLFAQSNVMQSKWAQNQIIADGSIADWKQLPAMYDSDSKIFYDIANDSSNLYFCFKVTDIKTQMQIMQQGMNIQLIYKGKPKRKVYIFYPLKSETGGITPLEPKLSLLDTPNISSFIDIFKLKQINMQLKGFSIGDGLYPLKNENGINAAINWDENSFMYYEITIPFKDFIGEKYSLKDLHKTLILNVELNIASKSSFNNKPKGSNQEGGISPNGGEMIADGGMRPPQGMGMGMGQGKPRMQEDSWSESNSSSKPKFSQKFKLTI